MSATSVRGCAVSGFVMMSGAPGRNVPSRIVREIVREAVCVSSVRPRGSQKTRAISRIMRAHSAANPVHNWLPRQVVDCPKPYGCKEQLS